MIGTGTRRAVAVAAVGLLLAGCGPAKASPAAADPSPAATAPAPAGTTAAGGGGGGGDGLTACGLITEPEASAAIGAPAGAGTAGGTAALSECIYDDGALIVGMKTDAKALYDKSYADATARGATDLPGVGDSAFAAGATDHATLELLKGTTLVSILYSGADAQATAVALAKVAAGKL